MSVAQAVEYELRQSLIFVVRGLFSSTNPKYEQ